MNLWQKEEIIDNKPDTTNSFPTKFSYGKIVTKLSPVDNESNVSHTSNIEIVFGNSPLQRIVVDQIKYRVVIDTIILSLSDNNIAIERNWKKDSILEIIPQTYLEPNSQYKFYFKAHYEIDSLGTWIIPYSDPYYEEVENYFHTVSVSTTDLNPQNVLYAYPVQNQYHYLQNEFNGGFIQLKIPQNELFTSSQIKVRISGRLGYIYESNATYSSEEYQISFGMPTDLDNETIYALELLKIDDGSEKELLTYHFRTSKFDNFVDKAASFKDYYDHVYMYPKRTYVHRLYIWDNNVYPEYFDKYEMGKVYGLIRGELEETSTEFKQQIDDLYSHLDKVSADFDRNKLGDEAILSLFNADILKKVNDGEIDLNQFLGIPPKECVYLIINSILPFDSLCLNEDIIFSGNAPAIEVHDGIQEGVSIFTNIMDIANVDWTIAKRWILEKYPNYMDAPEWARNLYESNPWPAEENGIWDITLKYTLPNGQVTSEKKIKWEGPDY
jgi:hypothetical protein